MKSLTIELTDQCYNNCKHCSSNADINNSNFLDKEKVFELIRDAARLDFDNICFSGGEPLLHPDLHDIIQYAATQAGMNVCIYTSGITKDQLGFPIEIGFRNLTQLKEKGLSKIIVGLQTLDRFTYSKFCCNNNYNIVMRSLDRIIEVFGNSVELNVVPNKLNIREIKDFVTFAHAKGIQRVNFLGLVIQGTANKYCDEICLTLEEHKKLLDKLEILKKMYPTEVRVGNPLTCGSCNECTCGINKLVVTPIGLVYGCESLKNCHTITRDGKQYHPDSVYQKSLYDIYNDSEYLEAERKLLSDYAIMYGKGIPLVCPIQRAMWNS